MRDEAGKNKSLDFNDFFESKGIRIHFSTSHEQRENGSAESTLSESIMMISVILQVHMCLYLWLHIYKYKLKYLPVVLASYDSIHCYTTTIQHCIYVIWQRHMTYEQIICACIGLHQYVSLSLSNWYEPVCLVFSCQIHTHTLKYAMTGFSYMPVSACM